MVRALDFSQSSLETVADHALDDRRRSACPRVELSAIQMKQLVDWTVTGGLATRDSSPAILTLLAPRALRAGVFAGPLRGVDGLLGALIIELSPDRPLGGAQQTLLTALLEPFSAALENDKRLREISALRESAEAERSALLKRLGRSNGKSPIIGAEGGLRGVMERVEIVSHSDVPILLLGETGAGKEVIARAVHDRSARSGGPFIRVNCGAIPTELIDSQLFGHERGSFTGAVDTHQGWFERADRGTLFLDEIGELPPAAQVRLLRVLQDGFIERVGGKHSVHVDVRIVAATHRDLAAMTRGGSFRQDLWYRIAVFPIAIPPLRERIEDIPALACHFAERAATRFGLSLVMPTPDDARRLAAYDWPGNVRELGAVIDRAALLGNGRRLEIERSLGASPTLPGALSPGPEAPAMLPPASPAPAPAPVSSAERSLDEAMRAHIEDALRASHGRVEGPFGAAVRLKINPHTLRSRMRRMGIHRKAFSAAGK